jgi:hypothetical protein
MLFSFILQTKPSSIFRGRIDVYLARVWRGHSQIAARRLPVGTRFTEGPYDMHSAIFVAVEPTTQSQEWFGFLDDADKTVHTTQHVERLGKNVWLVNFQNAPYALGYLISYAERHAISYRILPLADEPQWIPAGPNPGHSL